ncbi:MAG: serine/threonine protein kinase [Alcanivorax sp.]|jgi:serine/threonine protein kinase
MADLQIPGYELYEQLGRGGMATVYRALHLNLDREVAIKVMDRGSSSDDSFSERFIREARISARLVHPHILQIYDVNSHAGHNYIAMEFLGGGDLAGIIRGALTQRVIYNLMKQMTDALDYASSQGYVHRDIKPSNILLRTNNDYVLADFGIAKAADSGTQMTQTGLMVGTPSYMSPEQARGVEVDGRSDLYGMAVLGYEMLTKELPFDADSAVSIAVKHLTADIPTLPETLAPYQAWLDKALAKDANDRFQTGGEMFAGFSEVRGEFSDDDVLTPAKVRSERSSDDEDATSVEIGAASMGSSWGDPTQVSQSSRPSRPYKLSETSSRRERLVTGQYQAAKKTKSSGGGTFAKLFLTLLLVSGGGYGGYVYWQTTQDETTKGVETVSAQLSRAFTAMNENDLNNASQAFERVLEVQPTNAAALKGMADIGGLQKIERREKADKIVIRAQAEINKLATDASRSDAALTLLQEALQVDAGNKKAEKGLSTLADYHMAGARRAIDAGDFALAASTLVNALEVMPARSDIKQLSANLAAQEADWLASQNVKELFSAANASIASGEFISATQHLTVVLKIQPDSADAQGAMEAVVQGLLSRAQTAIGKGNFSAASVDLDKAIEIAPSREDLGELQSQLPALEEAWQSESRMANRLTEAQAFFRKGSFLAAAEVYREVLKVTPDSAPAQRGLNDAHSALVSAAQKSADKGKFDDAQMFLTQALELDSDSESATALEGNLATMEQSWNDRVADKAKQKQVAADAAELGMQAIAAGDLDKAHQIYREVSVEYSLRATTNKLKDALLKAYIVATRTEIGSEQYDLAQTLIAQGQSLSPEREEWEVLEEEIDFARNKARRRLGGF